MGKDNRDALAKVRMERARELLNEAKILMNDSAYKSANNRAYYSYEKAVKALLALKLKDAKTHAGILHLFNEEFIHPGDYFDHEDYVKFKDCEYIRSASDYDDFYVAVREDCEKQIENVEQFLIKVERYLKETGIKEM